MDGKHYDDKLGMVRLGWCFTERWTGNTGIISWERVVWNGVLGRSGQERRVTAQEKVVSLLTENQELCFYCTE